MLTCRCLFAQAQIVEQSALSAKMKMRERMREEDISNLRAKLVSYETHPPPSPFQAAGNTSSSGDMSASHNHSGSAAAAAEYREMEVRACAGILLREICTVTVD